MIPCNLYGSLPGIFVYKFVPTKRAAELVLQLAGSVAGTALLFQMGIMVGPYVAAAGASIAEAGAAIGVAFLNSLMGGVA